MTESESSLPDDVLREARGGDAVALARALVATPSVNPALEEGGQGEEAVARLAASWLEGWGWEVELQEPAPGRFNVLARQGGFRGPDALLLNGHLDTVGVEGMTVPPFAGEIRNGRLVGRGACDMKGGVAAILSAAAALAREGGRSEGGGPEVVVALTADEEHASLGMRALVESGVRAAGAVVCEPTSLSVAPAHKGFLWLELHFRGRAAHGSRPEEGVDAIRHAGAFLHALEGYEIHLEDRRAHPLLGHGTLHAGTIRGGTAPSVYPDRCELVLERRTLPGETSREVVREVEDVVRELRERMSDLDVELVPGLFRPGTEVPDDHPLVRGLLGAADAEGVGAGVAPMTAWVDAAFLNEAGIPAVCYGPGTIARAHSADEWAPVDQIRSCARVLERLARGLSGGPRGDWSMGDVEHGGSLTPPGGGR